MNEMDEAQEIGKRYAASQHLSVEDLAYDAQGKAKQATTKAKAKVKKASNEPLTVKEEIVMNGVMASKKNQSIDSSWVPAHSAADRLSAAKKERDDRQWLYCGNDRELEDALERSATKEDRLNRVTRNAMAPAPKPRKPRRTPLQMAEDKVSEIQTKLTAKTERRDGTAAHIGKITAERPHASAERKGVIDAALDILRGELLDLTGDVNDLEDGLRMAENALARIHIPRGNPVEEYEDAKKLYEAGKMGSAKLADYREAARVAIMRGMQ
jgi:hypothetical protein